MNELVDVYINGEKHKAMIIKFFDIEGRTFCLYSVPNGDETFGIHCGKKIGDQIVDIEDENENNVVKNIAKTILLEQKKETLLNMKDEEAYFTVTDDDGTKKQAHIVGEFEVDGQNYLTYAIDETEDTVGFYAKRVTYDANGEVKKIETITDSNEKEKVFNAIRNYINEEVGDL